MLEAARGVAGWAGRELAWQWALASLLLGLVLGSIPGLLEVAAGTSRERLWEVPHRSQKTGRPCSLWEPQCLVGQPWGSPTRPGPSPGLWAAWAWYRGSADPWQRAEERTVPAAWGRAVPGALRPPVCNSDDLTAIPQLGGRGGRRRPLR